MRSRRTRARPREAQMGNYVCIAHRRPVEERLTRPQRQILRQPPDFDLKKLRKLIRSHKLAPCFDALDESHHLPDLEECPICFFYFPSLNRSSCCSKGICTECFLQMLPPDATRSVRCPFCKTSCYAVEYRGARTKQEKDLEQVEEQKVIEAKIRMQDQFQSVEQVLPSGNTQSILEAHYPFLNLRRRSDGSSISSLQHQVFHNSDPKLRKGFNGS